MRSSYHKLALKRRERDMLRQRDGKWQLEI